MTIIQVQQVFFFFYICISKKNLIKWKYSLFQKSNTQTNKLTFSPLPPTLYHSVLYLGKQRMHIILDNIHKIKHIRNEIYTWISKWNCLRSHHHEQSPPHKSLPLDYQVTPENATRRSAPPSISYLTSDRQQYLIPLRVPKSRSWCIVGHVLEDRWWVRWGVGFHLGVIVYTFIPGCMSCLARSSKW